MPVRAMITGNALNGPCCSSLVHFVWTGFHITRLTQGYEQHSAGVDSQLSNTVSIMNVEINKCKFNYIVFVIYFVF